VTWVFDTIQEFLGHLKTVKDPELFETAIVYIERIMASVHDIDHALDQRIAKALDMTEAYKAIKEFNEEAKKRVIK